MRRHNQESIRALVDRSGGPDACHPWTGGVPDKDGYGRVRWQGRRPRAHHVVLEIELGRPLLGHALHTCDNPPCCNLAHLYEGTAARNAQDREARGRGNVPQRRPIDPIAAEKVREVFERTGNQSEAARVAGISLHYARVVLGRSV